MKVVIYGKPNCTYCSKALFLANVAKLDVDYRNINDQSIADEMINSIPEDLRASIRTVPQIFVDGGYVGGFELFQKLVTKAVD